MEIRFLKEILVMLVILQLKLEGIIGQGRGVCDECYRNSKSCRIISGIFTRTHLTYGYNKITQIPAGSCDIDISEMSRSRNYLAMQLTNGSYFINGDWRLVHTGNYFAAGTNFTYGRLHDNCPGECIRAKGPTSEAVDLMLLFYRTNPGIKYQYTIPAGLMERVIQTYQSDPVPSSTWAHRRRHQHFSAPSQTNSSSEFTDTQHTQPKDREASDQSFGRSIRFGQNPRYIAPEVQTSNYEPLQSNQGQHGTQEAINRFRAGSSNQVDTRNQIQLQTDHNRVEIGSVSTNYLVDDKGSKHSIYSHSGYGRTQSQTNYDTSASANQIENQPRIATTVDRINFMWRISGFTECSQTCGGGTQNTNVVCMKRNTNVIVTEDNCDKDQKPRIQTLACNPSPCPPSWETEPWSECSATCSVGMQRRRVECKQRISTGVIVPVSASLCNRQDRPISSQSCQNKPCAQWEIGNWTKCSVECGQGEKTREVYCKNVDGKQVSDEECEGIKPESSLSCDMGSCAYGWFHSEWSDECSTECGNGYHTRKIFCSAEDGTPLPNDRCGGDKPRTHKPCKKNRPCGGSWFTGPWSKCSATCGPANRIRDVLCMKKLGDDLFAIVGEENCQGNEKPTKVEECPLQPECEAEWFMTAWSECSATCDTGTKTREIKCLDLALQPSTSCDPRDKPSQRHTCNTESCDRPQLDQDPGCIDKWNHCKIVVQARLCSYHYYKNQCCKSCNDHEQNHHKRHNRKVKRG